MSMHTRLLSICAATSLALVSGAAFAAPGTIVGSKHDFKATTWGGSEVCKACHAPHNNEAASGLLWNHKSTSVTTYTLYSNTTMSSPMAQPTTGVNKLCLSCHDGTVGLDSYGGANASSTNFMGVSGFGTTAANFGTSLANDHPIAFAYSTDGGAINPTTTAVTFGDGSTGTIADMLDGGQMACMSCHDVHNTKAAPSTKLLLKSNTNSALCLTCHVK